MAFYCHRCSAELSVSPNAVVGRTEECSACKADVHVCLNCRHYDPAAYNSCRESQAERVVDKDRSNFCDYFSFVEGKRGSTTGPDPKAKAKKALDDLFKK